MCLRVGVCVCVCVRGVGRGASASGWQPGCGEEQAGRPLPRADAIAPRVYSTAQARKPTEVKRERERQRGSGARHRHARVRMHILDTMSAFQVHVHTLGYRTCGLTRWRVYVCVYARMCVYVCTYACVCVAGVGDRLLRDTTVQALTSSPTVRDGVLVYEDSPLVRAAREGEEPPPLLSTHTHTYIHKHIHIHKHKFMHIYRHLYIPVSVSAVR
jgi:hypothetical protein